MKTSQLLALIYILGFAFSGCQQSSTGTPPSDSFRLVVDDMVAYEDLRVATLRIQAPQKATVSVETEGTHSSCVIPEPSAGFAQEVQFVFAATRVAPSNDPNAYIQTLFSLHAEGGAGEGLVTHARWGAGGPAVYTVSHDTKLDSFVSLTAKSGVFKLDAPVEIGNLQGKLITLTVGKPTR